MSGIEMDDFEPEVFQAPDDWNGKCVFCGEDELEGGMDGGGCKYCGHVTIPPEKLPTSAVSAGVAPGPRRILLSRCYRLRRCGFAPNCICDVDPTDPRDVAASGR